MKRWFAFFFVAGAFVAWAQTHAPGPAQPAPTVPTAPPSGTVQGFVVPEYDATGQLRWRLFGDTARLELTGARVEVKQMKIELYREKDVGFTVESPVCLFDRTAKLAASDEDVRIVSTNLLVTGKGFEWNAPENRMHIRNDVTVRIANRKTAAFPIIGPQPKSK
jgi:lipopolysaccharide export system protein LptC